MYSFSPKTTSCIIEKVIGTGDIVTFPEMIEGLPITGCKFGAFVELTCDIFHASKNLCEAQWIEPLGIHSNHLFEEINARSIYIPPITHIPTKFFNHCVAEEIIFEDSNLINNVGARAFADTPNLKEIKWFPNCKKIPSGCFSGSGIKNITETDNVSDIESFRSLTPND